MPIYCGYKVSHNKCIFWQGPVFQASEGKHKASEEHHICATGEGAPRPPPAYLRSPEKRQKKPPVSQAKKLGAFQLHF